MADSDDQTTPSEATPTEGKKPKAPKAAAAKGGSPAPAGDAPPEPVTVPAVGEGTPGAAAPEAAAPAAVAAAAAPAAPKAKKAKSKKEEAPAEAPKVENLSLDPNDVEKPKIIKAKGSKNIHAGIAHVLSTFNNTIVTITDLNGNVIGWSSAGKVGFKGSRKSTAYAAQMVAQDASRQAMGHGLKEVEVLVRGPGAGRESAVRALQAIGLDLTVIRDVTPVPHNGCRPPKQRRV